MAKPPRNRQLNPIEFKDFSEESRKLVERLGYVVNPFIRETSAVLDGGVSSENLSEVVIDVDFRVTEDVLYPGAGGGGGSGDTIADLTVTDSLVSEGTSLFEGPASFLDTVTFGGPVTFTNVTAADDVTANDLVIGKNGVWSGDPEAVGKSSIFLEPSAVSEEEGHIEYWKGDSLHAHVGYSQGIFATTNFNVFAVDPIDYATLGATHKFYVGGTERAAISASGLAVSGALSTTGAATVGTTLSVTGGTTLAGTTTGSLNASSLTVSGTTTLGVLNAGAVTATSEVISGDLTVDTATFKVDSTNDRIGVGTAAPSFPFHLATQTTTIPHLLVDQAAASATGPNIGMRAARGTLASPTATQSSDELGVVAGRGRGATVYATADRAKMSFLADQAWTDSAQGTRISFFTTTQGSTTTTERTIISNVGNFSTGLSSTNGSGAVIHANSAFQDSAVFGADMVVSTATQVDDATATGLLFRPSRPSSAALQANDNIGSIVSRGHTGSAFVTSDRARLGMYASQNWSPTAQGTFITFHTTADSTTTMTERMRIGQDGKVIMGATTATPAGQLHVASTSTTFPTVLASQAAASATGANVVTRSARGTPTAPTALQSGDELGVFGYRGYGATAYSTSDRAQVSAVATQNWTDSAQGADVVISATATGSTTMTEVTRLKPSSSWTIGTVTAAPALEVSDLSDTAYVKAVPGVAGAGDYNSRVEFWNNATSEARIGLAGGGDNSVLIKGNSDQNIKYQGGFHIFDVFGTTKFTLSEDVADFATGGVEVQATNLSAFGGAIYTGYSDSSGTPGAATINKISGKAAIASAASSVVITNVHVSASSVVLITPMDIDATLTRWSVTPASGSFTVTGNAAATATWKFAFLVINSNGS